ncbi:MAG: hypothetical protein SGPRY_000114 [Prymnesium sp.]
MAAMVASQERAAREEEEVSPMRTPRRSNSAHYGCSRHTLRYLLRRLGLTEQALTPQPKPAKEYVVLGAGVAE